MSQNSKRSPGVSQVQEYLAPQIEVGKERLNAAVKTLACFFDGNRNEVEGAMGRLRMAIHVSFLLDLESAQEALDRNLVLMDVARKRVLMAGEMNSPSALEVDKDQPPTEFELGTLGCGTQSQWVAEVFKRNRRFLRRDLYDSDRYLDLIQEYQADVGNLASVSAQEIVAHCSTKHCEPGSQGFAEALGAIQIAKMPDRIRFERACLEHEIRWTLTENPTVEGGSHLRWTTLVLCRMWLDSSFDPTTYGFPRVVEGAESSRLEFLEELEHPEVALVELSERVGQQLRYMTGQGPGNGIIASDLGHDKSAQLDSDTTAPARKLIEREKRIERKKEIARQLWTSELEWILAKNLESFGLTRETIKSYQSKNPEKLQSKGGYAGIGGEGWLRYWRLDLMRYVRDVWNPK